MHFFFCLRRIFHQWIRGPFDSLSDDLAICEWVGGLLCECSKGHSSRNCRVGRLMIGKAFTQLSWQLASLKGSYSRGWLSNWTRSHLFEGRDVSPCRSCFRIYCGFLKMPIECLFIQDSLRNKFHIIIQLSAINLGNGTRLLRLDGGFNRHSFLPLRESSLVKSQASYHRERIFSFRFS